MIADVCKDISKKSQGYFKALGSDEGVVAAKLNSYTFSSYHILSDRYRYPEGVAPQKQRPTKRKAVELSVAQQPLNSVDDAWGGGPPKPSRLSGKENKFQKALLIKQHRQQEQEEQAMFASICDTTEITDSVEKAALKKYQERTARFEAYKEAQRDERAAALSEAMFKEAAARQASQDLPDNDGSASDKGADDSEVSNMEQKTKDLTALSPAPSPPPTFDLSADVEEGKPTDISVPIEESQLDDLNDGSSQEDPSQNLEVKLEQEQLTAGHVQLPRLRDRQIALRRNQSRGTRPQRKI